MASMTDHSWLNYAPVDMEFQFSINKFNEVGNRTMTVSNTTRYGSCWQLRMKIEPTTLNQFVNVDFQLRLYRRANDKATKMARFVVFTDKNAKSSPIGLFQPGGDISDPVRFLFKRHLVDLKVIVQELSELNVGQIQPKTVALPPQSAMTLEVLKWFQLEDFGDVTIVAANGKRFRCHRDVLSARSEVFRLMFSCPMKESKENLVKIDVYSGEIVASLLQFVYIDDCGEIGSIADQLYAAAHHYQLERLKILCESAMAANLSVNSIVKIYRLAKFYHLENLSAACFNYLETHKSELFIADLLDESLGIQ